MTKLLASLLAPSLALGLALGPALGCGAKQPAPAPAPPTAPAPEPGGPEPTLSADDCTRQGGEVRGDIGDGKIACAEGERRLGRVPLGIEGSICCVPAGATADSPR